MVDYHELTDGATNKDNETTDSSNSIYDNVDEPIENKWNDIDPYWEVNTEEEYRMSDDTPEVNIYISREIVKEEEPEEGEETDEGDYVLPADAVETAISVSSLYKRTRSPSNQRSVWGRMNLITQTVLDDVKTYVDKNGAVITASKQSEAYKNSNTKQSEALKKSI